MSLQKTVGITGADGFFGWHLRCRLSSLNISFLPATRSTFADTALLDKFVSACDVVVHLAGVNRANSDAEVRAGNVELAVALNEARARTGTRFDLVYANSVHATRAGAYGESKAEAAALLKQDCESVGATFRDIYFPHLFGEFGSPYYNSAVSTFAYELANGKPSEINDGRLELVHVQDAADLIVAAVEQRADGEQQVPGRVIGVVECYELMNRLADYRSTGELPNMGDDPLELQLFNVIRSHLWPAAYPMDLTAHTDSRGSFFEVVRAHGQGQTSLSTTRPGVTRGDHYHRHKIERFAVVHGEARIRVRRLMTPEIHTFDVSGDRPCFIDMPTLCTHNITNTGRSELITLFWSHDHFDANAADTYPLPVNQEEPTL